MSADDSKKESTTTKLHCRSIPDPESAKQYILGKIDNLMGDACRLVEEQEAKQKERIKACHGFDPQSVRQGLLFCALHPKHWAGSDALKKLGIHPSNLEESLQKLDELERKHFPERFVMENYDEECDISFLGLTPYVSRQKELGAVAVDEAVDKATAGNLPK